MTGLRAREATRRGSVYVMALATLLVGMTLGLALVSAGTQAIRESEGQEGRDLLSNAARGGLAYGYWNYRYSQGKDKFATLPFGLSTTLSGCDVSVSAVNNSSSLSNTILISATATRDGRSLTVARVYPKQDLEDVFDYAFASDTSYSHTLPIVCGSSATGDGDVYVNGSISWTAGGSAVYGAAYASGTVNSGLSAWEKRPDQATLSFPNIDLGSYLSIANVYYGSDVTLTDPIFAQPNAIIYVNGDLQISGTVTGSGTIVVSRRVTISNDLTCTAGNRVAILAMGDVTIAAATDTLTAIVYAPIAKITVAWDWSPLVMSPGELAAKSFSIAREVDIVHDPALDDGAKQSLHLPNHF